MSDQPMGHGWWLASDGKWYAPEMRPDVSHDALTEELPAAGSPPATPSPPSGFPPPPSGFPPPPSPATPSQYPPTMTNPSVAGQPPSRGPNRGNLILVVAAVLLAFVVGGCVAVLVVSRSKAEPVADSVSSTEVIPSTTAEQVSTSTTVSTSEPESSTTAAPEPTPSTATSLVPPPPTTEPEQARMPDVVCMDLQTAQNTVQKAGVFFSKSFDASGAGRMQIIDRNWIVVSQDPDPGTPIGEFDANLGVVKKGEPNPC